MTRFGLGHLGLLLQLVHGIDARAQSSSTPSSNYTPLPSPVSPSETLVSIVPTTLPSSNTVPSTFRTWRAPRRAPTEELPKSDGFWVAGLEATQDDGSSYSQIISGPNQHIQCLDIGNAVVRTMKQATPHYVIDAYIIENAGTNDLIGATAAELAGTEKAILLKPQECLGGGGGKCFRMCNGALPAIEIAGHNGGDLNTSVRKFIWFLFFQYIFFFGGK